MDKIKGKLGFGYMRLPMIENEVDIEQAKKMTDLFMASGFNYFDTAHGYIDGKSEKALKVCLVDRYNREDYIVVDKLSGNFFEKEEDLEGLFNETLEACGLEYFDIYLMHALSANNIEQYRNCNAIKFALNKKKEGKVKHVGFSFHDTAEVLDQILTEFPELEIVQIQLNYLDYEDPLIQSRKCYEVCRKHNKPVIIMEPVKGGRLVNLPDNAKQIFDELNSGSAASYAIRFAASLEGVVMVLSGMSNMEQMEDNISYMKDFKPLSELELQKVLEVSELCRSQKLIPCTNCRYCVSECAKNIPIPDLFICLNSKYNHNEWQSKSFYNELYSNELGKASDCIKCGKCEKICPQHLNIRDLLLEVKESFEK